jgi:hypothetical protein
MVLIQGTYLLLGIKSAHGIPPPNSRVAAAASLGRGIGVYFQGNWSTSLGQDTSRIADELE